MIYSPIFYALLLASAHSLDKTPIPVAEYAEPYAFAHTLLQPRVDGNLVFRWSKELPEPLYLAGDEEHLFVMNKEGKLTSFDLGSGTVLAERHFEKQGGEMQVDGGNLYAVADSHLHKLKTDTLETIWISTYPLASSLATSGLVVGESGIAVNTSNGMQFFTKDGTGENTTVRFGMGSWNTAPVFLNASTVAFFGQGMAAYNAHTKSTVWQLRTGQTNISPLVTDGSLFISLQSSIARINPASGNAYWETPLTGLDHVPAVTCGIVVVPTGSGMYGLNANSGRIVWRNQLRCVSNALPWQANGVAVVAMDQRGIPITELCILDATTGTTIQTSKQVAGVGRIGKWPFIRLGSKGFAGFYAGHLFVFTKDGDERQSQLWGAR